MSKAELSFLHPTVSELYVRQRALLTRIVRVMFALAGCMWIIKYIPQILPHDDILFTKNQYQLYLILLTLWGYDYRRELVRMKVVLGIAKEQNAAPDTITQSHIQEAQQLHRFDILSKQQRDGKWFAVLFTWLLLLLATAQILRQCLLLFVGSNTTGM